MSTMTMRPLLSMINANEIISIKHLTTVLFWFASFCSLYVLIVCLCSKRRRQFPSQLILIFTTFAFFFTLNVSIGSTLNYSHLSDGNNGSVSLLCKCQGFLFQFLAISLIYWYLLIYITLYLIVCRSWTFKRVKQNRYYYYGVGFLVPIILSVLPSALDAFGHEQGVFWCWIGSNHSLFKFVFMYAHQGMVVGIAVCLLISIIIRLHRLHINVFHCKLFRCCCKQTNNDDEHDDQFWDYEQYKKTSITANANQNKHTAITLPIDTGIDATTAIVSPAAALPVFNGPAEELHATQHNNATARSQSESDNSNGTSNSNSHSHSHAGLQNVASTLDESVYHDHHLHYHHHHHHHHHGHHHHDILHHEDLHEDSGTPITASDMLSDADEDEVFSDHDRNDEDHTILDIHGHAIATNSIPVKQQQQHNHNHNNRVSNSRRVIAYISVKPKPPKPPHSLLPPPHSQPPPRVRSLSTLSRGVDSETIDVDKSPSPIIQDYICRHIAFIIIIFLIFVQAFSWGVNYEFVLKNQSTIPFWFAILETLAIAAVGIALFCIFGLTKDNLNVFQRLVTIAIAYLCCRRSIISALSPSNTSATTTAATTDKHPEPYVRPEYAFQRDVHRVKHMHDDDNDNDDEGVVMRPDGKEDVIVSKIAPPVKITTTTSSVMAGVNPMTGNTNTQPSGLTSLHHSYGSIGETGV